MATFNAHTQTLPFNPSGTTLGRSRALRVAVWIVSVAAAGMFLMAGWAKLAGAPEMVQTFDLIGVGQWFRYVTGGIEVVSAVALLAPPVALYAALALVATMAGALVTHLAILGGSALPALILLVATSFIAWARWMAR